MPFLNNYNKNVSDRLNTIYLNHIRNEDQINDNLNIPNSHDIVSQQEHVATLAENPDTVGGSAHEMTTLHDLGFEKTTSEVLKPRRTKVVPIDEGQGLSGGGMSAGGMSAGAIVGCGMSAGSMPKRQRKRNKKESGAGVTGGDLNDVIRTVGDVGKTVGNIGAAVLPYAKYAPLLFGLGKEKKKKKKKSGGGVTGGDFNDVINTVGDVAKTVGNIGTAVLPYAKYAPLLFGLGKGKTRTEIVKEVMIEKGLKLIDASKYVKEHGLYKPKDKTGGSNEEVVKTGGSKKAPSERSQIVKQVMLEKGLKLIEASQYVKEHGLYKPKEKGGSLLSLKSIDTLKGDTIGPQTITKGNVKPLKQKFTKETEETKTHPLQGGKKPKSKSKSK